MGTIHHEKCVGQFDLGRCRKCEAIENGKAGGNAKVCKCADRTMREKSGDWANYLEIFSGNGKVSVWTSARVSDRGNGVEQQDEGRLSHVHWISCREEPRLPETDHRAS